MNENVSASFLDKTDWRVTLHRKLEACVDAEGTIFYNKRVCSLISAVSASYPGWDARREVTEEIKKLEQKYTDIWEYWLNDNLTRAYIEKENYRSYLKLCLHKDVFEYIKNMCARKRMLLWGSKKISGGTQMED